MRRKRFTTFEFHQLFENGILDRNEKVELLNGEIYLRSRSGAAHAGILRRLTHLLVPGMAEMAIVSVQNAVELGNSNQPQPDFAILRKDDSFFTDIHPEPEDIHLIIEIARTAPEFDRILKLPLYAKFGIPEIWLINIDSDTIEAYSEPFGSHYKIRRIANRNDSVRFHAFGLEIPAKEILG